jgi:hypothetical protein
VRHFGNSGNRARDAVACSWPFFKVAISPTHHQEVTNMPASGLDQTLGFIGSPSWLPTLRELTLCVVLNSPGCASPAALGFFLRRTLTKPMMTVLAPSLGEPSRTPCSRLAPGLSSKPGAFHLLRHAPSSRVDKRPLTFLALRLEHYFVS